MTCNQGIFKAWKHIHYDQMYNVVRTQHFRGTYAAQGGTPSPSGSQARLSSSWGHSDPPPVGSRISCLLRDREPWGTLGSEQIFEQEPHELQSLTTQSLGIRQDWYVSGRLQWGHWLIQDRRVEGLVSQRDNITKFLFSFSWSIKITQTK